MEQKEKKKSSKILKGRQVLRKFHYLSLWNEIFDNTNTYSIEECVELAIHRFDVYQMENEMFEKIEKKYRVKDEISKKVLTFQQNRYQNKLRLYKNLIITKFNDMPESPKKAKLEKKIKSRKIEKSLFDLKLRVEITPEELHEMPAEKKINYHMTNYDLYRSVMQNLSKKLNEFYKEEKFKYYELILLEYDYNQLIGESSDSYGEACRNYFLELPLDHPHRKQIKESILGSGSLFDLDALTNLIREGEKGRLFEEIIKVLFPGNIFLDLEKISYEQKKIRSIERLPLDNPDCEQFVKNFLNSESSLFFPFLTSLLYSREEGHKYKDIIENLFPDSIKYYDDEFVYHLLSGYTFGELVSGNIDIINVLRSKYFRFDYLIDRIPSDVFARREELLSETIKAEITRYKKDDLCDRSFK